jgi:effector-binding domain-containing protein
MSNYQVQIVQVASQPTAVVRRRARQQDLSRVVPEACGIVWNVMKAQQVKGAGRHVALYLDGQINLEVGVELERPFADHGEVVGSSIPAGTVATVAHIGPYQKLGDAHAAIRDWCRANGREFAGPSWEIYGHWTDDVTRLRTDVFYLLKT